VTASIPSSSVSDDIDLMRRIADRDALAVRALYDRYSNLVYSLAIKMLGNRADADDLVADVFFELWNKASRYDHARAAPVTYIVTLTRSRCIDRRRRKSARPAVSLDAANFAGPVQTQTPADDTLLGEQRAIVREALDGLEPWQREAIEAAYFQGLTHTEISDKLGRPLGTVKTHIRLGLIRLRELLRKTQ